MSWFGKLFGKKDKPAEPPAPGAAPDTGEDAPVHDAAEAPVESPDVAAEAGLPPQIIEIPEDAPDSEPEERDLGAVKAPRPEVEPDAAAEPAPDALSEGVEAEPSAPEQAAPAEPEARKGFFARIAEGLRKSSSRLGEQVSALFNKRKLDDEALEELEELLIASDLGAPAAARVVQKLAREKFDKEVTDREIREALAETVAEILTPFEQPLDLSKGAPCTVLFVGVNGSGKTTTLGKLAVKMTREGANVMTVAGDTFRAAAVEQLEVWSERAGARFMSRPIGADAAGLAYDAVSEARASGHDAVLIDSAGRLQNKAELMDELRKILRVIRKLDAGAPHHVVLVLDGTVGSNAVSQAEAFMEAADVTGVVMTKLDGTAKGGALVQVAERFQLPIHFIGVGEGEADLQPFSASAFARALAGLED